MTVAQLVARERARLSAALVARGAAAALAIAAVVAAASAFALGEARWITRPAAPLLAWAAVLALVTLALWWTSRAVRGQASDAHVAEAIERERALRAGALRGALEVAGSGALGRRAADSVAAKLQAGRGPLAPSLQRRTWRRGAIAAAAAVVGLVALGAARTRSPDGWRALRHPVSAYTGELLSPMRFLEPATHVMRGERLRLEIAAPDRRRITLALRTTGRPWRAESLAVESGLATATVGPLDADVMLVARDGRTTSDTLIVRVTDRPFVGDVAIRARYPAYLGRAAEVVPTGEKLRVPQGTVLGIRGRASTALARVGLARGSDTLRFTADGHAFAGDMTAETGLWSWWAAGAQGAISDIPAPVEIEVIPDSAPRVEILAPTTDTVMLGGDEVGLRLAATDDHGLAAVSLRSWRRTADGRALPQVSQALDAPSCGGESGGCAQWSADVPLDVAARQLEPGDELHVVAAATDASPWRQTGTSRELVLRMPSLEERRAMARTLADSAASRAVEMAKAQKQLEQRTGDESRSRGDRQAEGAGSVGRNADGTPRAMSFEAAERTRSLAAEQQQMQEQVKNLQQSAKQLERQLQAAGALDSSLARQLRDVQKLLGDALTPELQQQLQQLQASAKMSPDETRRSLAQLAEQQQRLREQLEKSAEMLKRAAMEGAMQTLRDDARELAARERAYADSMARGDSVSGARGRELSDRSRDLSEQIDQLSERLKKEKAETGASKLQQASQSADKSADAMRQAAQDRRDDSPVTKRGARSGVEPPRRDASAQQRADTGQQQTGQQQTGQQQSGQQSGEQAADRQDGAQPRDGRQEERRGADAAREGARQMESAAQQLADARQSQINEWKNELTGELDQSIQEMLQLARQQQALADKARSGEQAQEMRGEQSAVQQGAERVGERLQKSAGKSAHVSPQSQSAVGDARRKVQEATERVASSQRANESAEAMDEAAQALNRAAASLVKDRERAAGAQSASGFAEMLQRMQDAAKQQGQINAQSAGLLPLPGAQAAGQARALGAQQRALAKKLEEGGEGEGGGRSQQMAKEMKEIADQLDQGRVDAGLLDRQQRLFRRLLDAGLSMEKDEREDQGERESTAATGNEGVLTPGGTAHGRDAVRWREPSWNELRGLTAEERRAVLEYFKRINAEQPTPP